jgi:hypothetical protein
MQLVCLQSSSEVDIAVESSINRIIVNSFFKMVDNNTGSNRYVDNSHKYRKTSLIGSLLVRT